MFPLLHHSDMAFCFPLFSSLLVVSSLSRSTSAAVSRPRHPTLPSAADINQPLCGKQREGRREGRVEEEKAWRQPVIRTNVDRLRIADHGGAQQIGF